MTDADMTDIDVHAAVNRLVAASPFACAGVPLAVWRDAATQRILLRTLGEDARWLGVSEASLCHYVERHAPSVTDEAVQAMPCRAYRRQDTIADDLLITHQPE